MDELLAFGISVLRFHCLRRIPLKAKGSSVRAPWAKWRKVASCSNRRDSSISMRKFWWGLQGRPRKTVLKTRELVLSSDVNHCTLLPARGSVAGDAVFATEMFCVASSFSERARLCAVCALVFCEAWFFELAIERVRKSGDNSGSGPSTVSRLGDLTWANGGDIDAYIGRRPIPEVITESVVEMRARSHLRKKEISRLWQMGSTSLSVDFGNLVCEGRLTAQGCLDFDEVARRIVAEFVE